MLRPITMKFTDESSDSFYSFTFYCDICEKPYKSPEYDSLTGDNHDPGNWGVEHKDAYERANNEVLKQFNRCPTCGRVVCDECFSILDDMDVCKECNAAGLRVHNSQFTIHS